MTSPLVSGRPQESLVQMGFQQRSPCLLQKGQNKRKRLNNGSHTMLMHSYPISFTIHESLTHGENPIAVSVLAIYQSSAEMSVTFLEYRVVMFVSQSNEDR